jgi:hypothetical protein
MTSAGANLGYKNKFGPVDESFSSLQQRKKAAEEHTGNVQLLEVHLTVEHVAKWTAR